MILEVELLVAHERVFVPIRRVVDAKRAMDEVIAKFCLQRPYLVLYTGMRN